MYKPDKICPICNTEGSVKVVENATWNYPAGPSSPAFSVEGITCMTCQACGEEYVSPEMDKANLPKINEAKRKAMKMLSGAEIEEIVEKTGLSAKELENVLGLGPHSFTRWKKGQVIQSPMADALLIALKRDPGLVGEMAARRDVPITNRKKGRPATKKIVKPGKLKVSHPEKRDRA